MNHNKGYTIEKVGKYRPLCMTPKGLLLYRRQRLYLYSSSSKKVEYLRTLQIEGVKRFFSLFRITERLARAYARNALAVDGGALICANKGIYYFNMESGELYREHTFCRGMSNALALSHINRIEGFDDCVVYGDYVTTTYNNSAAIYKRTSNGWVKVYEFAQGIARHIHAIVPDKYRGGVLILTGDKGSEVGFWIARNNFETVEPLAKGEQTIVSCFAVPLEAKILYATDTPSKENWVCQLVEKEDKWTTERVSPISGPCIFGCVSGNSAYISTSVEPNNNSGGRIKKMLIPSIAEGCKDNFSHVYSVDLSTCLPEEIASFRKDVLPSAFEYGNIKVVAEPPDIVYIYAMSTNADNMLYLYRRQ